MEIQALHIQEQHAVLGGRFQGLRLQGFDSNTRKAGTAGTVPACYMDMTDVGPQGKQHKAKCPNGIQKTRLSGAQLVMYVVPLRLQGFGSLRQILVSSFPWPFFGNGGLMADFLPLAWIHDIGSGCCFLAFWFT